jgi:hypothetical protein
MKPAVRCSLALILALGFIRTTTQNLYSAGVSESEGDWSESVDGMRGRLVANSKLNAEGATEVDVYVELQNLDAQPSFGKKLNFKGDMVWALSDGHGNAVPPWTGQSVVAGWSTATVEAWTTVPANSALRFRVCVAGYYLMDGPMALVFFQGLINTPPWHIAPNGHGPYFLSALFKGSEQRIAGAHPTWNSTLNLPPVPLPTGPIHVVWRQNGVATPKIGPESTNLLGNN